MAQLTLLCHFRHQGLLFSWQWPAADKSAQRPGCRSTYKLI